MNKNEISIQKPSKVALFFVGSLLVSAIALELMGYFAMPGYQNTGGLLSAIGRIAAVVLIARQGN